MQKNHFLSPIVRMFKTIFYLASTPSMDAKFSFGGQIRNILRGVLSGRKPAKSLISVLVITGHFVLGLIVTPISACLWLLGFRFLTVRMRSIGAILYLDSIIRDAKTKSKVLPIKFFTAVANSPSPVNPDAYNLYRSHVIFIYNPVIMLVLMPFFMNPFFKSRYDHFIEPVGSKFLPTSGDERWNYLHEVWGEYNRAFNYEPLAKLSEDEVKRGRKEMIPLLPEGKKFALLHVRDDGYKTDEFAPHGGKRNADIFTYEDAVRYLIDQGYYVVRMGDAKMTPIDEMISRNNPYLIDYARSDLKSDFLDCYLVSECDFFIGTASGLLCLAIVMGKPLCLTNYVPACNSLGYIPGDITTFKKYRYISDGSLVSFPDLLRPPCAPEPTLDSLNAAGIFQEDNSPEELLHTVKEFIERRGMEPTPLQKKVNEMLLPSNYSYRANGHFSNTILRLYFPDESARA